MTPGNVLLFPIGDPHTKALRDKIENAINEVCKDWRITYYDVIGVLEGLKIAYYNTSAEEEE